MFECSVTMAAKASGFCVTFENEWTISVQWGPGNYADNYDEPFTCQEREGALLQSKVAEIAAFNKAETMWWDFDEKKPVHSGGYVKGWVKPDELIGYMQDVSEIALDVITASEYEYLNKEEV